MVDERRKTEGENPVLKWLEEKCPVTSQVSVTSVLTVIDDTKQCLVNGISGFPPNPNSAEYPHAPMLALRNKYIANEPIQLVFITPQEAAAEQAGKHNRDYTRAFQSLDREHYFSTANPGHTMLFPAGTKLTPVLDRAESRLARAAGTTAADGKAVVEYAVKGVIARDLGVPYSNPPLRSGNAAFLVQIDDGRFAMVMGGAFLNTQMVEPYKFQKPPVPLSVQDRRFNGSAEEFAAALPRYMESAASAAGLNPRSYDRITAFLIDAAKTCDGITPDMAQATVATQFGPIAVENLRNLGKQYTPCWLHGIPDELTQEMPRRVMFSIVPLGAQDVHHQWRDRKAMHVEVLFTPLPSDPRPRGSNGLEALFANYGIVTATITRPQ